MTGYCEKYLREPGVDEICERYAGLDNNIPRVAYDSFVWAIYHVGLDADTVEEWCRP